MKLLKPDQSGLKCNTVSRLLGPQGLLLTPACDIDYAPFDNIVAFVEAVQKYGRIRAVR